MITVIYERGDATNPENYGPICGLPQLYKLFSAMLYNRLCAELEQHQCPDQAGFRKHIPYNGPPCDVQTHFPDKQRMEDGHVGGSDRLQQGIRFFTTCSNLEISEKSFGQCTIHLLPEQLYTDQGATELTDVESDEFGIARGTKQGDPSNSLHFNSVLQAAVEKDIVKLGKERAWASSE